MNTLLILDKDRILRFFRFPFNCINQCSALTIESGGLPIYADNLTKKLGQDVEAHKPISTAFLTIIFQMHFRQTILQLLSNDTFQRPRSEAGNKLV